MFISHFDARGTPGREAGWTLYFTLAAEEMGREAGTAGAFVMPAARSYAVTPPASVAGPVVQAAVGQQIGSKRARVDEDPHAAAWAAARAEVLGEARVDALYAAYQTRKKGKGRDQAVWWNGNNNRGGAKRTVEGGLGEYQADRLFAAQGHTKLNHSGALIGLNEPPKGKGIDGVWRNASPPPDYLITETKYDSAKLSKGQMSDEWVTRDKRLSRAVGEEEARRIQRALAKGQVGKRLLHINTDGELTELGIDKFGKVFTLDTTTK